MGCFTYVFTQDKAIENMYKWVFIPHLKRATGGFVDLWNQK